MYSTWKVVDLKEELKKRGGKVTGKKADLIERLEFYDRNADYNNNNNNTQASPLNHNLIVPSADTYRDVNSSTILPKISKQHIQSYFDRFDKKLSHAKLLYESRYLLVLRSSKSGEDIYLKERDEKFIEDMVSKLELFYEKFFKGAVINKYFYKDYDSIIKKQC